MNRNKNFGSAPLHPTAGFGDYVEGKAEPRYWHGGAPGLSAGDRLTSAHTPPDLQALYRKLGAPTGVYFSTDREFARGWAACAPQNRRQPKGAGALYEVRPLGGVLPDPDFPGHSWFASTAEIVRVVDPLVQMDLFSARAAVCGALLFEDGSPMYSSDGTLRLVGPHASWVTKELLEALGPWPLWDDVMHVLDGIDGVRRFSTGVRRYEKLADGAPAYSFGGQIRRRRTDPKWVTPGLLSAFGPWPDQELVQAVIGVVAVVRSN